MDLLHEIKTAWAMYREFRAARTELGGYSDRELNDLGLTRGDVTRVAYEEAERRVAALHRDRSASPRPAPRPAPAGA